MPLRVAAIDFLNPAPLMWDFHHPPHDSELRERYALHLTAPSQCARELLDGRADLGLIPIAALSPQLAIVPGCTIASLDRVRSIQLVVRPGLTLQQVRTVAADTASLSSAAYVQVLFRRFFAADPEFLSAPADLELMLANADAALLIGDPALLALERQADLESRLGHCTWHDVAALWHTHTSLPWVAAVWAVCAEAVPHHAQRHQLIDDLNRSRINGLQHIEDLVSEWTPRIALPPATIRTYLTQSIHYNLDDPCIAAIRAFRSLAAEIGVLPQLSHLHFLTS